MIKMRDEKTMMDLIVQIAKNNERIRAVIMNGSRTSPSAPKDIFQDYDIIYIVTDVESLVNEHDWVNLFGERLIMQTPDLIDDNWPSSKDKFAYLMLFKDWNRIDLTLLHVNKLPNMPRDSLSILLLDKDNLIKPFDLPSDKDYLPKPPTKKQFNDCCNEFLWVSTYVAKGIWRKQLTYAKQAAEQCVKEELLKLMTWYAGINSNFEKTIGTHSKYLEKYLEPEIWCKFVSTYVDADYNRMWDGLFIMCEIFFQAAIKISSYCGYTFDTHEFDAVVAYLKAVKESSNGQSTFKLI